MTISSLFLQIGGMTCGHCVAAVTGALEGVAGVESVAVDLESGFARVGLESGAEANVEALVRSVEDAGFEASFVTAGDGGRRRVLQVEGMSCAQCEAWVRKALGAVEGVTAVEASWEQGTATVEGGASVHDLEEAVRGAGYGAAGDDPHQSRRS